MLFFDLFLFWQTRSTCFCLFVRMFFLVLFLSPSHSLIHCFVRSMFSFVRFIHFIGIFFASSTIRRVLFSLGIYIDREKLSVSLVSPSSFTFPIIWQFVRQHKHQNVYFPYKCVYLYVVMLMMNCCCCHFIVYIYSNSHV